MSLRAALAAVLLAAPVHAHAPMPVMVGLDGPDLDACGGLGRVIGLDPQGDNFLAVRGGPDGDQHQLDEVHTDDLLHLCDKRGRWWGVVYDPSGAIGDCGVGSPVPEPEPYGGPCRSGWVFDRYVELVAG